jgi:hypothetical protein
MTTGVAMRTSEKCSGVKEKKTEENVLKIEYACHFKESIRIPCT